MMYILKKKAVCEEGGEDGLFMCPSLLDNRLFQNAIPQVGQTLAENSTRL